jgi:putative flippase GtrA
MNNNPNFIAALIIKILDFFFPLVKRFMSKQNYYYIACGGANTLLGFVIYYLMFHYILKKEDLNLGFYSFKPHIAAFFVSFGLTFPIGFLLSKYIVWSESYLKGKQQLFRHIILVAFFVLMNYALLKLFVEVFYWWPMPSQILTTSIILVFSYLSQKYVSFKN